MSGVGYSLDSPETQPLATFHAYLSIINRNPVAPMCKHMSECPSASPLPWSSWSQDPKSHLTINISTTPRPGPLQRSLPVLSVKACFPVSHIHYFSRPMMLSMQ